MAYCRDCGSEVKENAKFCPDCGTSLSSETTGSSEEVTDNGEELAEDDGLDYSRGATAAMMGLIIGAVVAFAFTNIGGSSILFFVTLIGVTYYLYDRKHSARSALGSGFYILALWVLASPIMFYIPIVGGADTETAAGAGTAIGGALGILIWGFAGLIVAVIIAAIGYFVNRGVEAPEASST